MFVVFNLAVFDGKFQITGSMPCDFVNQIGFMIFRTFNDMLEFSYKAQDRWKKMYPDAELSFILSPDSYFQFSSFSVKLTDNYTSMYIFKEVNHYED